MRHPELLAFFDKSVTHMRSLMENKNHDYAGPEAEDALSNFTTVEMLGAATTEQGFLTRMTDKFKRVITFCNVGVLKVKDEKVTDALLDLANYCILMAAYIHTKQMKRVTAEQPGQTVGGLSAPAVACTSVFTPNGWKPAHQ